MKLPYDAREYWSTWVIIVDNKRPVVLQDFQEGSFPSLSGDARGRIWVLSPAKLLVKANYVMLTRPCSPTLFWSLWLWAWNKTEVVPTTLPCIWRDPTVWFGCSETRKHINPSRHGLLQSSELVTKLTCTSWIMPLNWAERSIQVLTNSMARSKFLTYSPYILRKGASFWRISPMQGCWSLEHEKEKMCQVSSCEI